MFSKHILDYQDNLFPVLMLANEWEEFTVHRMGAILVAPTAGHIPIVRTTTAHRKPSQEFRSVHYRLMKDIEDTTKIETAFNNAMAEVYDDKYTNMKFHTDQALDLAEDSYICLFSCYEDENVRHPRKLVIKEKRTGTTSEITLDHNSIVLFSVETNRNYLHKIMGAKNVETARWLGITFRRSKTFARFGNDGILRLTDGRYLKIANDEERKEFFRCKKLENQRSDYRYPELCYTLSNH